jgi:hypothetical protein
MLESARSSHASTRSWLRTFEPKFLFSPGACEKGWDSQTAQVLTRALAHIVAISSLKPFGSRSETAPSIDPREVRHWNPHFDERGLIPIFPTWPPTRVMM